MLAPDMPIMRKILRPLAYLLRAMAGTNGLSQQLGKIEAAISSSTSSRSMPEAKAVAPSPNSAVSAPKFDPNLILHDSRSAMLREMPPGAQRFLSAGCSGLWYFSWLEQCYGPVPEHIGIEYYVPKPEGLAAYVTWIENTASNMSDVADASCDLVFSGQNVEHLWPDEVAGFLMEAARVTAPGGYLVMDSPNRTLTAALNWSHPEHTIELTHEEAAHLFHLAGFDVTKAAGLWLCRDPRTGRLLPFDPNAPETDWTVTERLIVAQPSPEHAFLWWIEGRRATRSPDQAAINAMTDRLFRQHWPERLQRLIAAPTWQSDLRKDGEWLIVPEGRDGVVFFGPYAPLKAGRYRCTFRFQSAAASARSIAVCDVTRGQDAIVVVKSEISAGQTEATMDFTLDELAFGIQFRCISRGDAGFSVRKHVQIEALS